MECCANYILILPACGCSSDGTIGVCNPTDGKCLCKRFVMGARCDRCQVCVCNKTQKAYASSLTLNLAKDFKSFQPIRNSRLNI